MRLLLVCCAISFGYLALVALAHGQSGRALALALFAWASALVAGLHR